MTLHHRALALAIGLLLLAPSGLRAQTAADPSGHWAGSIEIPNRTLDFQLDVAKNRSGDFGGAITVRSDDSDGFPFPLNRIAVDGTAVTFYARSDSPFHGVLSGDGRVITGTAILSGYELPFTMRRTGEAQFSPAPTSRGVGSDLEGSWSATLAVAGQQFRLVLTVERQPAGAVIARLVDLDEGGLVIPVVITQEASRVSYASRGVRTIYSGELNAAGTELAGTWTQGELSVPLTFHRAIK